MPFSVLTPILAALLGGVAAADDGAEQRELDALVADLVPVVEQAAGRRFTSVPEVVVATPRMLQEVLYREQVHLLEQIAGMTEEEALVSARVSSSDMSTAFVGKYGFLDKKLYVMRDGITLALATRGVPLEEVDKVTELVIAHELTHALQDQHTDLGAVIGSRRGGDAVIAATCTVEGHAVWVQERVGAQLGHERAVQEVAAILGYEPGGGVDLSAEGFYTAYIYGQGRNFIAWHQAREGDEAIWSILADPPAATSMIMEPHRYGATDELPFDRRARRAVDRARKHLVPRGWTTDSEAIGDYDLRERLLAVRHTPPDLPDAWTGGWSSQASRSPIEWAEVQLLGFDDPGAAEGYVAGMTLRARMDLAQAMPPVAGAALSGLPRVDGSVAPFAPMADELAAEQRFTFDFGGDSALQHFRQVWVTRDGHVVQVAIVNRDVPDRRVARAIRRVFRSIE